jgi:hypothetical protein
VPQNTVRRDSPQANKTVVFNGEKLVVQTQKESRAVLARFEDDDLALTPRSGAGIRGAGKAVIVMSTSAPPAATKAPYQSK